jgi:hypothetical protein
MRNDDDYYGVTKNPFFVAIHWLYTIFKWSILGAIVVSFGNTTMFHKSWTSLFDRARNFELIDLVIWAPIMMIIVPLFVLFHVGMKNWRKRKENEE